MNDFTGETYDYAAGSLKGMRSWQIDTKGRLRGVTHAAIWRPGENASVCQVPQNRVTCPDAAKTEAKRIKSTEKAMRRTTKCPCGCGLPNDSYFAMGHVYTKPEPCGADPECNGSTHPGPTHTFDPDCGCGFWAYDDHTFKPHGDITGIIEGYGKTTIGTKGFRCEKARIVALCRQRPGGGIVSMSAWSRLQSLYPDVAFYATSDEMVAAHPEVLHSWTEPEDGFWDEPTPVSSDAYGWMAGSVSTSLQSMQRAMLAIPSARYSLGGQV